MSRVVNKPNNFRTDLLRGKTWQNNKFLPRGIDILTFSNHVIPSTWAEWVGWLNWPWLAPLFRLPQQSILWKFRAQRGTRAEGRMHWHCHCCKRAHFPSSPPPQVKTESRPLKPKWDLSASPSWNKPWMAKKGEEDYAVILPKLPN